MIHLHISQLICIVLAVAFIFFHIGAFYEYSRRGGALEARSDARKALRETEKMRELLYAITHHASVRPQSAASVSARRLTSVKG